jgi:hypothetical protein
MKLILKLVEYIAPAMKMDKNMMAVKNIHKNTLNGVRKIKKLF